jgi:hypothetical protein
MAVLLNLTCVIHSTGGELSTLNEKVEELTAASNSSFSSSNVFSGSAGSLGGFATSSLFATSNCSLSAGPEFNSKINETIEKAKREIKKEIQML